MPAAAAAAKKGDERTNSPPRAERRTILAEADTPPPVTPRKTNKQKKTASPKQRSPKSKASPRAKIAKAKSPKSKGGDGHTADGKQRKADYWRLGYKLKSMGRFDEYRNLSWGEKQDWCNKFRVDPEMTWMEAKTTTETTASAENHAVEELLTQSQLGGPLWMNDAAQAKAIFDDAEVEKLEHPQRSLAKAGVQVVKWNKAWRQVMNGVTDKTALSARGEVEKEEYERIRNKMLKSVSGMSCGAAAHARTPSRKAVEDAGGSTPGKGGQDDAAKARTKALQKAMGTAAKYAKLVTDEHLAPLLAKSDKRVWGPAARTFITDHAKKMNTECNVLMEAWSLQNIVNRTDPAKFCMKKCEGASERLDSLWASMETEYLSDIKAMK